MNLNFLGIQLSTKLVYVAAATPDVYF